MYNNSEAYTILKTLVGWGQETKAGSVVITAANLVTDSGLTFQNFSGLVTTENVKACQNDQAISDAVFNTYLAGLGQAAINKVLRAIFSTNDVKENRVLFTDDFPMTETLDNDAAFVGYEIEVCREKDIAFVLNKAFLTFTGTDKVKLLLFHSSQNATIESKEVAPIANTSTAQALAWVLKSMQYAGGSYYLGYLRGGLGTTKAISRQGEAQNSYNFAAIRPIRVDTWNAETLFDINNVVYTGDDYGLNFDASSLEDWTNVIVTNKERFTNAVGLQMAADVLDLIINTVESNHIERNLIARAKLEREGNLLNVDTGIPKSAGILNQLKDEIKQLKRTFFPSNGMTTVTLQ